MASSGCPLGVTDGFGTAPVGSGSGVRHRLLLGTVDAVDQADDGRRQEESAGDDDGVVKDLDEHDVGPFPYELFHG